MLDTSANIRGSSRWRSLKLIQAEDPRGLSLGAARVKVRSYFGECWADIMDTPNQVPADFWPELGITAFYRKTDALLYLAFEKDNITLCGDRLNARRV